MVRPYISAPKARLPDHADLVTELKADKHDDRKGLRARVGIEK